MHMLYMKLQDVQSKQETKLKSKTVKVMIAKLTPNVPPLQKLMNGLARREWCSMSLTVKLI